jgi:ClpP class serine protease
MAPTAMMMVHNVSSVAEGDYHAMDKESDILKQCNKSIAAAYVMKSGMSEEDALKMMDKESWLTAKQAKEKGLIDAVMFEDADPSQLVNAIGPGMIPKAVIEKTLNMLKEQNGKNPPADPPQDKSKDLAYAKLNLIQKTYC